ncbi:MAG: PEP-CTERM sorting domain-containing protein, partial [Planctomycetota bacterium]|nr:PEP-CTERM sorting domain-containing protein [Planctomycetota bacterium]
PTAAGGHDLFALAIHEIGHSLNVLGFGNGLLPITMGPYAGQNIPVLSRGGGHIDVGTSIMYGLQHTLGAHRIFPTEIDIAAVLELTPGLDEVYLYDVFSTATEVSPGAWRYDYTVVNYGISTYDIAILGVGGSGGLMSNLLGGGPLAPGGTRTVSFSSPFAPTSGTAGVRFADGSIRNYHTPVLTPVPEPSVLALLGGALLMLCLARKLYGVRRRFDRPGQRARR